MNKPVRIQRTRKKGWVMPEGALYVGRGSLWGNDYRIGMPHPVSGLPMSRVDVLELFRKKVSAMKEQTPLVFEMMLEYLRSKKFLACWCSLNVLCHADVWIEAIKSVEGTESDSLTGSKTYSSNRVPFLHGERGIPAKVLKSPRVIKPWENRKRVDRFFAPQRLQLKAVELRTIPETPGKSELN